MGIIRAGVIIFDSFNKVIIVTTINKTSVGYPKGFPKGHKNKNESSIKCAIRELYEETGIKRTDIIFLVDCDNSDQPICLTNGHDKAHYFVAKFVGDFNGFVYKKTELRNVEWYDVKKAYSLKELSKSRKDILRRAYHVYTNNPKFEIILIKNSEINTLLIFLLNDVCERIISEYCDYF